MLAGARHRLSMSTTAADVELADAEALGDALTESPVAAPERAVITIRDFAFAREDARHAGLGPDVPPACDPRRLARRLRRRSTGSAQETDSDWEGEDGGEWEDGGEGWGEGEGEQAGWMAGAELLLGKGRLTMPLDEGGVGPADFARNFGGAEEEGLYYEEAHSPPDQGTEGAPGIYRAAFEFEGVDDAEVDLEEGQLVCVTGGGASGWAVVRSYPNAPALHLGGLLDVHERIGARTDVGSVWTEWWAEHMAATGGEAGAPDKRALAPASYLVLVRGEGESEDDAKERLDAYLEWLAQEQAKQAAEEAELRREAGGESPPDEAYEDAQEGGTA